jgi:hypothetical protein
MRPLFLAALLVCAPLAHAQTTDNSAASLEGLWESRTDFGAGLSGELVVSRNGQGWVAQVGDVHARGDGLSFDFPDGQGRFAGIETPGGRTIEGWWTQPPGPAGQAYTTPMRLSARGRVLVVGQFEFPD